MSTTTTTTAPVATLTLNLPVGSTLSASKTIDLDQEFGDWRDDFARDGFVILKGAIPADRAEAYHQRFFGWIEKWGMGFQKDDRSTWTQDHIPMTRKGGMFHHSVGQEAFVWDIRQEPGVMGPFAHLWGTEELLVSFDGANLSLPGPMQDPNQPAWWHIDQDPDRRGCLCAQGLVNLNHNGPDDGGLMVLKNSHKLNDTYFTQVWNGTDGFQLKGEEAQNDFFGFSPEILDWFYANGCEWVKPDLEPGDLVIWDSRTVHYNVPPQGDTDRCAVYTCFAPARLCDPEQLKLKQDLFAKRKMSTHWPCTNLQGKPSIVLRNGEPCKHTHDAPFEEPILTDRLLKLAGVKPY